MNIWQQMSILGIQRGEVDSLCFDREEDYLRWRLEKGLGL